MTAPTLVLLTSLFVSQTAAPAGQRIKLEKEDASLFIPEGYKPRDGGRIDLVLQLHGAASVVESALVETKWPAVLVVFNRKGLSSVYTKPFSEPELFPRLLDSVKTALKEAKLADDPKIGKVFVSSFSAGFGGVRELLKSPEAFKRIDGLVMTDSIYAGYRGKPVDHKVDAQLMDGFCRFALEAAEGRKTFLLTHSEQVPEGYASTTEVADFLIEAVGGKSTPEKTDWGQGLVQTRSFVKGKFEVLGFTGKEADDHMRHLRQVAKLWKQFLHLERG